MALESVYHYRGYKIGYDRNADRYVVSPSVRGKVRFQTQSDAKDEIDAELHGKHTRGASERRRRRARRNPISNTTLYVLGGLGVLGVGGLIYYFTRSKEPTAEEKALGAKKAADAKAKAALDKGSFQADSEMEPGTLDVPPDVLAAMAAAIAAANVPNPELGKFHGW